MGEQSLTINSITDSIRSNGQADLFSHVRIAEYYTELIDLLFCLRSKDQFDTLDTTALPIFKEASTANLQVSPCIWKLDTRLESNWLLLLKTRLLPRSQYHNRVGYHKASQSFLFKWHDSDDVKVICWKCVERHCTNYFKDKDTSWGLPQILSINQF